VESSPPVPLSVPERGDVVGSPSPEGRGGQGVRTGQRDREGGWLADNEKLVYREIAIGKKESCRET